MVLNVDKDPNKFLFLLGNPDNLKNMNEFDKTWIGYVSALQDARNESTIITSIKRARRIVFIAKGRVGLATKMFMQRLSQLGYDVAHSEDH